MRAQMTITDLSDIQFQMLQKTLPAAGFELSEYAATICVVFVFQGGFVERHIEMGIADFTSIWNMMSEVARQDATRRECDHGAQVADETPSAFSGAGPIRTYTDGCQSYGPYKRTES